MKVKNIVDDGERICHNFFVLSDANLQYLIVKGNMACFIYIYIISVCNTAFTMVGEKVIPCKLLLGLEHLEWSQMCFCNVYSYLRISGWWRYLRNLYGFVNDHIWCSIFLLPVSQWNYNDWLYFSWFPVTAQGRVKVSLFPSTAMLALTVGIDWDIPTERRYQFQGFRS